MATLQPNQKDNGNGTITTTFNDGSTITQNAAGDITGVTEATDVDNTADNGANIFDIWTEPESAANTDYQPIYPFNNITQTESGHSFEMDDTPTRERIRIQHRSNTFIEMHPNGSMVQKIWGNGYEIIANDKNVLVKGICNITVEGDAYLHVIGDKIEKIDGNYECHVEGDYAMTVEGDVEFYAAGDMAIGANPNGVDPTGLTEALQGSLTLFSGDHVYIDGDLHVEGTMSATAVYADTQVWGYLVGAGLGGFVTNEGGMSIGPEALVAVPGQLLVAGDIFCIPGLGLGSVNAVTFESLISFNTPGFMNSTFDDSILQTSTLANDLLNWIWTDTHFHISKAGPTTPPPVSMVA